MFSFVGSGGRAVTLANGFVHKTLGKIAVRRIRDKPIEIFHGTSRQHTTAARAE